MISHIFKVSKRLSRLAGPRCVSIKISNYFFMMLTLNTWSAAYGIFRTEKLALRPVEPREYYPFINVTSSKHEIFPRVSSHKHQMWLHISYV